MNISHKVQIISLMVLFFISGHAFGLKMTQMPEDIQTKSKEPKLRALSLKLPLMQPEYHWTFMSEKDFLSGKLVLYIIREKQSEGIVIFQNGRFSDGWKVMSEQQDEKRGEIYFGFISTKKYLTAPGDKLELELTATKDLMGIGPEQTGILHAGVYKSTGTYTGLIDIYDTKVMVDQLKNSNISSEELQVFIDKMHSVNDNKAFLENWNEQWSLNITKQRGWLTDEQLLKLDETISKLLNSVNKDKSKNENTTNTNGTVYDEKGKPLSDASIMAFPRTMDKTTTDKDGKFSLYQNDEVQVLPNSLIGEQIPYLIIRHKALNLAAAIHIEDEVDNLEIKMETGSTLSGKVLDPNGNGIQNAEIKLIIWTDQIGFEEPEQVEIDKQGNYEIKALPSGLKYSVAAHADGFGRSSSAIQTSLTPGDKYEVKPITLKVANMSVSGIVMDKKDNPVANANIFLTGTSQQIHNTTTDENGRFSVDKICEGEIRIEASKFAKPQLAGNIRVQAGSTNVKIVISEVDSRGMPVHAHSLINEQLPRLENLFLGFRPEKINDKKVLVCFWDYEQRPSRNCILELAKQVEKLKEQNIEIIAIQASKTELASFDKWTQENNIPFTFGVIPSDQEKTQFDWGVKSLPWLILTDKNHKVTAEGFSINDLDEKLGNN